MNDESYKAKDKALSLLNYRMRTEKELREKLLSAEFSEEAVDEAIAYVKSYGYLNDRTYAEQYVYSKSPAKGGFLIKRELREKGIPEEMIEEALEENETDVPKVLSGLLIKKCGEPHALDEKEYRRAFAFLGRRGFDAGDIYTALKTYVDGETID